MQRSVRLADASRESTLALRRVERQQVLIEKLHRAGGDRVQLGRLALDLGVSTRTLTRDVERLRSGGVPIDVHRGRGGGISLASSGATFTVTLDLPEIAALLSSLAVVGPSVSDSATSVMQKLTEAVRP